MSYAKLPIKDIKEVVRKLKTFYSTRNATYKGRKVSRYIWVQRDLGDVIIQAEYSVEFIFFMTLRFKDIEAMVSLTRPDINASVYYCTISKDYLSVSDYKRSIEEALSALTHEPSHIYKESGGVTVNLGDSYFNIESIPLIDKLSRHGTIKLVNSVDNQWYFVQGV